MKANYRYYKWISEDDDSHFIYVNFKENVIYVLKCIRYVMNRNQLCKVLSPKSSETEQIALFHCS